VTLPQNLPEIVAADVSGPEPLRFPLEWIITNGSPPVQYRAIKSVAMLADAVERLPSIPLAYFPGLRLAVSQRIDGTWNGSMLEIPSDGARKLDDAIGTIPAVHRLLELGYDPDFPPFLVARRTLFRLLAEDNDPAYLFELGARGTGADYRRYGRRRLREAAAAVLARLGYESDPRLRGCANRMVQRVRDFLQSPLAEDPWVRIGNKHAISPDATPPSVSLLVMLAHMPLYRHENHEFLKELREYLIRPVGQKEVQQQVGDALLPQPQLVLGDPLTGRSAPTGDVATTLFWLETLARLGLMQTHEAWGQAYELVVRGCDRDGIWRASRGGPPRAPSLCEAWAMYPLDARRDADAVSAEVTTRLGIIARAAGREVELA